MYTWNMEGSETMIEIKLKEILNEQGKTMTWLHDKTGISKNTLSLMTKNSSKGIQFDTLEKICTALKITPNDLINISVEYQLKFYGEAINIDNTYWKICRYIPLVNEKISDTPDWENENILVVNVGTNRTIDSNLATFLIDFPSEKFLQKYCKDFLNYKSAKENETFFRMSSIKEREKMGRKFYDNILIDELNIEDNPDITIIVVGFKDDNEEAYSSLIFTMRVDGEFKPFESSYSPNFKS